jgi:hypothetical protein
LSVEAVQVNPICVLEEAAAVSALGALGPWVSPEDGVVADAVLE